MIRNAKVGGSTLVRTVFTSRRAPSMIAWVFTATGVVLAGTASAQGADAPAVYRCRQANGTVTYQDYACKGGVAVEIKPDAADPAAIARLRRAQVEFDRSYAQRRAAEAAASRREQLARGRAPVVVPGVVEDGEPPAAGDAPEYLLYGPIPPTRLERRDRRPVRPIVVPERRLPAVIRRPSAS